MSAAPPAPYALAVAGLALDGPVPVPGEQVLEGAPSVAERALSRTADGRRETGVWQLIPGVCTDVEGEETFVVVAGRATVEIEDGGTLELAPGVVGALPAGARTIWRVTETLRKVYVITVD